ncbi:MAG: tetratricopeptide repeat protein [Desulfobacteraceae bacterium]|nr:tetratricopeptide repeat protein [Desulfobacteraceae bacterium]
MKKKIVLLLLFFILFSVFFGCKDTKDFSFEEKGDLAYKEYSYEKAIHFWNRSYLKNPENTKLLEKTARAFLKLGEIDKALEYYLKASKKLPDSHELKKDIARIYLIKGEERKALELTEQIFLFMKDDADFNILYGDIYLVSENSEKACEMYKKAVLLSNGSSKAFIKLAIGLYESENISEAENYISRVINNYVLTPEDNILLSDYYFVKGDIQASEKYILRAVSDEYAGLDHKIYLCSFYLKTAQSEKACNSLEKYAVEYPKNLKLKMLLADTLISLKKTDKAELLLEEIKKLSGKNIVDYNLLMGKYWLYKGNISYAVSYLKDACEKKPYLVNANYLLGIAYFAGGQLKLAEKSFTNALVLAPSHRDSLFMMASIHYKLKEYELCLQYLDKIEEYEAFNPRVYILKGLCFFEKGEFEKASDLFSEAYGIESELSSGFFLGKTKEALKDFDEAFGIYKEVLNENGFVEDVFYRYISLLAQQGKYTSAKEELDKFFPSEIKDPVKIYIFASLFIKVHDFEKAETVLKKAIENGSDFEGVYLKLASLYKLQDNFKEMEQILLSCLDRFPGCSDCTLELGDYYIKRNLFEKAVPVYEKAVKLGIGSPLLMSNYAWILADMGKDLDIALDYSRKAYDLEPDKDFICDTLGYIYYLKGAYSQSLWMFEKAREISPEKGILQYHLGLVSLKLGKLSDSKKYLEKALKSDVSMETKDEIQKILSDFGTSTEITDYTDTPEENIMTFPEKLVDETDILTPQWN